MTQRENRKRKKKEVEEHIGTQRKNKQQHYTIYTI